MFNKTLLVDCCNELEINLCDEQVDAFALYYEMLIEKNKVMNLTAITEMNDVILKHFVDSMMISNLINKANVKNIIDIGTGAGFPGIPLKILYPEIDITLNDSLAKRLNFLNEVIAELNLKGIKTIHSRAEELAKKSEYRESFDLCVSRAVANLATLSEYCLPFVKVGGMFISYKANDIEAEFNESKKAIDILGGNSRENVTRTIPTTDINRVFVVIDKKKETPLKYPRKAGLPSKEPIV